MADEFSVEDYEMNHTFLCTGPTRTGGSSVLQAPKNGFKDEFGEPEQMTINKCLQVPDCACEAYLNAVDEMEKLS